MGEGVNLSDLLTCVHVYLQACLCIACFSVCTQTYLWMHDKVCMLSQIHKASAPHRGMEPRRGRGRQTEGQIPWRGNGGTSRYDFQSLTISVIRAIFEAAIGNYPED
jgi:hypothetical protein